ncbi:hypothetical protein GMSM_33040 [Geomonas sp. Red276]
MQKILVSVVLFSLFLATAAHAFGYNYVSPDDFKKWLETGKQMQIVDIQLPIDFKKHHFKAAMETDAFPVKSPDDKKRLERIIPQLAAGRNDVVVVCPRGGGGAKNAYDYLKLRGIPEKRLFILEDGMEGWPYKQLTVSGK